MTGSAKIARFIAAVLCGSALLSMPAYCAAPKDALKYLQFSHASSIRLSENDGTPARYMDSYNGRWTMDWRPPDVKLGKVASLKPAFHYTQTLTDRLDKIAQTSSDSRRDYYRVNLDVRNIKYLTLNYTFDRNDEFQNRYSKNSQTNTTTRVGIALPNLPSLNYGSTTGSRFNGVAQEGTGTESNQTWYQVQFKRNAGAFGQEYKYKYQAKTGTPGLERSGFSQFNGSRQFKFDKFGTLQLSYDFRETNKYRNQGETNELTNQNVLSLSYNNKLKGFPLDYMFRFSNFNNSVPGDDNSEEHKFIKFTYNAPVPAGKRLTLTFDKLMKERFQVTNKNLHKSYEITNLAWGFQTNPRTSGSLRYTQTQNTDVKLKISDSSKENLGGNIKYRIPGNQGEMNAIMGHVTEMSSRGRSINDTVTINNTFKLNKDTRMVFFYTQNYSGNATPRGENTLSGFNYIFNRKEVSLNARWQQNMGRPNELQKNVTQNFAVHFAYVAPTRLRYDFLLNNSGNADVMNQYKNSKKYQSKNDIELKVTYTF